MKLWAILPVAAMAAFAQTVEVTVVSAGEGTPLPGVKVDLVQNDSSMRQGFTDARGAYRFDAVREGDYTVEFNMSGYREANRMAAGPPRVHVGAGANPVRIEARMLRLGQISGRVTGGGKPVASADVVLFLTGNFIGQIVRTNERGEFQFHDVDPGTYILSAHATRSSAQPAPDEDGRRLAWARTWYPAAADQGAAARVLVTAGADLPGQDILLRAVPVRRVSGRVLSPKGEPVRGAAVKAAPPEEFAVAEFEQVAQSKEDGRFEFAGLPDGNWRLTAEAKGEGLDLYAALVETVAGRDIEGLELRFVPPFALQGKVVRTPTGTPAEKKTVGVILAPREGGYRISVGKTGDDGSFEVGNVAQGIYRFQPTSPGAPYYLASVEMNGHDVTGQYVDITPGTLPVTITYRADGGVVRGTVGDCGGASVVLAPQDPVLQYPEFVRQTKCRQDGRFEFTGVRPGEYYAFAFDRPVGMQEYGSFAGKWINQAVRVTVRPGEASDASLKVTQRGQY